MFEETYIEGLLAQGQYQNHDQKIVSQVVDYNGIKTVYDELGQLLWTADIENGQTVCQKTFYSGGHPQSITPFVEGQISGQKKTFDQSGAPISVEEWTAGTQHGKTILFENGEKVAEIPYQNGQINGVAKKFRRSSEVIEESSWKNGVQQGPCHTYFDSKKITSWYFNGQKVSKAKYDTLRRA